MRQFYKQIVELYELEEHRLRLLLLACETYDRGEQARKQIARDGLTFKTRYGEIKPHPVQPLAPRLHLLLLPICQLPQLRPPL